MSLVRGKDTGPERIVRAIVWRAGFRYRLHDRTLPGAPDLVFRKLQKVIFVHGCFWHRHSNCALARLPKSRPEFWLPKLEANRLRDRRTAASLRRGGWRVKTVWECEITTRNLPRLTKSVLAFLSS